MDFDALRYVVEVARCGSISGASKTLYVAQPNLSRVIRDLEDEFGITIFQRLPRGVIPTTEGALFLRQAAKILEEAQNLRESVRPSCSRPASISLSVPRASYISESFSEYMASLSSEGVGIVHYDECSSLNAIRNLRENHYGMAIIRYAVEDEEHFLALAKLEGLRIQRLVEFTYHLLVSTQSPLTSADPITEETLSGHIEILHGDERVPGEKGFRGGQNQEIHSNSWNRKIYISERGSQFDLLSCLPLSYMWVSPMPHRLLAKLNLVQLSVESPRRVMRDALLRSDKHAPSQEEKAFLTILQKKASEGDFDRIFTDKP